MVGIRFQHKTKLRLQICAGTRFPGEGERSLFPFWAWQRHLCIGSRRNPRFPLRKAANCERDVSSVTQRNITHHIARLRATRTRPSKLKTFSDLKTRPRFAKKIRACDTTAGHRRTSRGTAGSAVDMKAAPRTTREKVGAVDENVAYTVEALRQSQQFSRVYIADASVESIVVPRIPRECFAQVDTSYCK